MLGNEANLSEVHKQAFGGEREQIRSNQVQRNETGLLARSIASGGRRWLLWRILFQLRRCSDSPEQQSLPLLKNDTCSGGVGLNSGVDILSRDMLMYEEWTLYPVDRIWPCYGLVSVVLFAMRENVQCARFLSLRSVDTPQGEDMLAP